MYMSVYVLAYECVCMRVSVCECLFCMCVGGHTNDQLYPIEGCAFRHMSVYVEAVSRSQMPSSVVSLPYSLRHGLLLFLELPPSSPLASKPWGARLSSPSSGVKGFSVAARKSQRVASTLANVPSSEL